MHADKHSLPARCSAAPSSTHTHATVALLSPHATYTTHTTPRPSTSCTETASTIEGVEAPAYRAAGQAAEVIPRTLAQNCGANVIRTLTKLRARHAEAAAGAGGAAPAANGNSGSGSSCSWGINGETGACVATDVAAGYVCRPVRAVQTPRTLHALTPVLILTHSQVRLST
jgi:chaperonin GroEL (HSP60 family)